VRSLYLCRSRRIADCEDVDWVGGRMTTRRRQVAGALIISTILTCACGSHKAALARQPNLPAPSGNCPASVSRIIRLTNDPPPYPPLSVPKGSSFEAVADVGSYPESLSKNIVPLCVAAQGKELTTYFRAEESGQALIQATTAGCTQCNQTVLHARVVVNG
jgi:hypothetical protein